MPQANTIPGFNYNTRTIIAPIGTDTAGSGTITRINVPQTGLLLRLWCTARGTINTVSGPNALGQASIIRRIRLQTSASIDIMNVSGASYFHLLRPVMDGPFNPLVNDTATVAIAGAGTVRLDFVVPVEVNLRDQIGIFPMQNRQTFAQLIVEWELDATTGITAWTTRCAFEVWMELATVPEDAKNMPLLGTIHTVTEDTTVASGAGTLTYYWPLGNKYIQMIHGAGIAASGADSWSRFQVRANQHDFLWDVDTSAFFDVNHSFYRGLVRSAGVIPLDLSGSTGLGLYGPPRDIINSGDLTDLATVITLTGALTFYSCRREVVNLASPMRV